MQVTCNECGGRGKVIKKVCPHCQGHKLMDHTQHYTLDIPTGVPEGHEVVFEGEADESPDWEAGDIVIRVRSKKEMGGFKRKQSGLYWTETIGLDDVGLSPSCALRVCGVDTVAGIVGLRAQLDAPRRPCHNFEA